MTVRSWLRRRDPGLAALRRAGRVTIAGCVGFYLGLFVLGDSTTAAYAIFGSVALGVLAGVSGPPAQRTRTYAGALAAGLVLVTLGTLLAVSTWAAAAGMLLVGFAVAFSAVGGPRLAAVANGLQLIYILPCFPPYAPDTLLERLTGLAIGVILLAVADRVLWPAPAPPHFTDRLAGAAESAAGYADAVGVALHSPAGRDAFGSATLTTAREAAVHSAEQLRLSAVQPAERPAGPGVRDRSLTLAAAEIRIITNRLATYTALAATGKPSPPAVLVTADLLGAVAAALREVAGALRGAAPPPAPAPLDAAVTEHLARRTAVLAAAGEVPADRLRAGITVAAIADAARGLVSATRAVLGAPDPPQPGQPSQADPAMLSYLHASPATRWWRRLRLHLTPRSVYLQNAVRLAVGLAAARGIAGVFELSHGFWVLLATLSLMGTSVVASRAALVPAFAGTVVGSVVAGGVLTLVGDDSTAYALLLPLVMVVAFVAGPVLGVAAAQGGFTLVVAVLFAQLDPATWQLAATRLLDVVVGGLVGALIGAAVWPRGAGGEVRRVAAAALNAVADEIAATTSRLTGAAPVPDPTVPVRRLAGLFDLTYAQLRSEPDGRSPPRDWSAVLGVVHRVATDAATLRARHPDGTPLPWPQLAEELCSAAADVATAYQRAAAALEDDQPPPAAADRLRDGLTAHRAAVAFATAPQAALRVLDTWGWLYGLVEDLARIELALTPAATGGRATRSRAGSSAPARAASTAGQPSSRAARRGWR